MRKVISSVMFLFGMSVGISQADTHYVSPSGSQSAPYTSWATASHDIQLAVNAAVDGDTVLVTNGTYTLTNQISVTNAITLQGVNGFSSTIVNGNYPSYSTRCFYIKNTNAILDGFTITNGYSAVVSGGGVYLDGGGLVRNCRITGNRVSGINYGGGVYINAGGTVSNCDIIVNSSTDTTYGRGGGVYMYLGGVVSHCNIISNTCGAAVGGLSAEGGGLVENCRISNNSGGVGGIMIYSGATVRNCLISRNRGIANFGGGMNVNAGTTIANCTIVSNSVNISGGGVYNYNASSVFLNCIIYGNTSDTGIGNNCGGAYTNLSYSCTTPLPSTGTGNVASDPLFQNASSGDYHLIFSVSPCFNTGTNQNWMATATDLDGYPRIMNGMVDMGCYEYLTTFEASIWTAVEIGWNTLAGTNYQVQWTTNIQDSSAWTNMTGVIVGNGAINSVFDSTRTNPARYYRIRQL